MRTPPLACLVAITVTAGIIAGILFAHNQTDAIIRACGILGISQRESRVRCAAVYRGIQGSEISLRDANGKHHTAIAENIQPHVFRRVRGGDFCSDNLKSWNYSRHVFSLVAVSSQQTSESG